ncbi:hypothetical protein LBRM_32_3800 [Leishmania braziliensis MHOM/BR/75/M2904]|uniref:C3H1-type domain-containing protein n=2 Tax=Leishmania braziliensis TaxID=5660 RepID=A4HKZ4_LEIBR|nr:hypothetical protein LBRM_32_3800 [Leishmania braziliensis MHOM/BR/75/M2904]CAJ2478944.1 unnamed protein product [Leishmania braziliensis]CAM43174.2 hypothetical protein LBRM_32_3800 [Leishmania braziliensis MHOM/BR/75/M2904]
MLIHLTESIERRAHEDAIDIGIRLDTQKSCRSSLCINMFADFPDTRDSDASIVASYSGATAPTWSWTYSDKNALGCDDTDANLPAPEEADVKALLKLLSTKYDVADPTVAEVPASERSVTPTTLGTAEKTEGYLAGNDSLNLSEDLLRVLRHKGNADTMTEWESPTCLVNAFPISESEYPYDASSTNAQTRSSDSSSGSIGPNPRCATPSNSSCDKQGVMSEPTTPHVGRHTTVSHTFEKIGSGLATENFNVLTPDKHMMLSIPAEYIQTTLGSRNYLHRNHDKLVFSSCLCKMFCSGATCCHGSECDFIHCRPDDLSLVPDAALPKDTEGHGTAVVHSFQVHWSTPVASLLEAAYPRLPSGYVVYVKGEGNARGGTSHNATQALPSEMVYATVGGQEALRLPSSSPLRICKHFEREKCARGALCHFIHPVVLMMQIVREPVLQPETVDLTHCKRDAVPSMRPSGHDTTTFSRPPLQTATDCAPQHLLTPVCYTAAADVPPFTGATPQPLQQQMHGQPTATANQRLLILTTTQPPPGALVRYEGVMYMWGQERKHLVPLQATKASNYLGSPDQTLVTPLGVDYSQSVSGLMGSPLGYQMPVNAMLTQSSSFFASSPAINGILDSNSVLAQGFLR